MPYIVNFTDKENKTPITVFDNTSSTDTSLTFPGRNVVGYGQIIAENFLKLLENFSKETEPNNPIEGQLWYDTNDATLKIYDGISWKAASNVQKGPTEPVQSASAVGELWVDTTNQQLRIYTGTRWILVGPVQSTLDGLRYGPSVETLPDSDNRNRTILIFYIADIPIFIISKDTFIPKIIIPGFSNIRTGLNLTSNQIDGFFSRIYGVAQSAAALQVGDIEVPAGRFLRSDVTNTVENNFIVRGSGGITLGIDGTFNLSSSATAARIYNSTPGSSIDFQTNRDGIPGTVLRVIDDKVGINRDVPDEVLDVVGNIKTTGSIIITNTAESTNLNNGSLRTLGGMSISKNLLVGEGSIFQGEIQSSTIIPISTDQFDCGTSSRRWRTLVTKKLVAEEIEGNLIGNIDGNANTATNLKNVTSFRLQGDVVSDTIQFDGQIGSYNKIFTTSLTSNIISDKPFAPNSRSEKTDQILVFRPSFGLNKQSRDTFLADAAVPIGAIIPFAGQNIPFGYLLCDGSETQRNRFPDLFDVIGNTYGVPNPNNVDTFKLPDLRGRFALGRDNMDNNLLVATITGGTVDSGGGNVDRVPDTNADILGGSSGRSSVTLEKINLPQHEHTLQVGDREYNSVRVDTSLAPESTSGVGPTAPGGAQYVKVTGGIDGVIASTLAAPIGVMNPYLTINYIIRSGPPRF
jgi:microcystin-dependent protein